MSRTHGAISTNWGRYRKALSSLRFCLAIATNICGVHGMHSYCVLPTECIFIQPAICRQRLTKTDPMNVRAVGFWAATVIFLLVTPAIGEVRTGDFLYSQGGTGMIYAIDRATGQSTAFSGDFNAPGAVAYHWGEIVADGPEWSLPVGIGVAPSGEIIVGGTPDYDQRAYQLPGVYGADPQNGSRSLISGDLPTTNVSFATITGLAMAADGTIVISEDARNYSDPPIVSGSSDSAGVFVFAVDRTTGERHLISSSVAGAVLGNGPTINDAGRITVARDGTIFSVGSTGDYTYGLFKVDPHTGDRSLISGGGVGSGPAIDSLASIVVNSFGQIFATSVLGVERIDPLTGDRTLIAPITQGTGINLSLHDPTAIALGPDGKVYVADLLNQDAVYTDQPLYSSIYTLDTGTGQLTNAGSSSPYPGDIENLCVITAQVPEPSANLQIGCALAYFVATAWLFRHRNGLPSADRSGVAMQRR
jgi:hypothetical protein